MKLKLKKVAGFLGATVAALVICLHPIGMQRKPDAAGISVCGTEKGEVDLPPEPLDLEIH